MDTLIADQPRLLCRSLDVTCDPCDAIVTFARYDQPAVLESVCNTSGYGRYTLLAIDPIAELPKVPVLGSPTDPFATLAAALSEPNTVQASGSTFVPGWIGCIPYECGESLNALRSRGGASTMPRMALYDSLAVYDHQTREWSVTAAELPASRRSAADRLDQLERLLRHTRQYRESTDHSHQPATSQPIADLRKADYLAAVRRAKEHIAAGDIYQVNLTQRFTADLLVDPLTLYLRLRRANPSDFAAYLAYPDRTVLSCSPELFLHVDNRQVRTRPIKGTAARDPYSQEDADRAAALLSSAKDRAELNMIIDLLRNDLGRVCEYGSVKVVSAADVERHPTVLHLVATIDGCLRSDVSIADLLRASFPGGSVTGCPKIRAMQIIRDLEQHPRDVYCGSIGYFGLDGRMTLSVAIRTMLVEAGKVFIYAGGAITADSDPEAEYRETLAKAAGMIRACGHSIDELETAVPYATGDPA